MTVFWAIAAGISLLTALILVRPLLRAPLHARHDRPDIDVYRDQLSEVDRDLTRGVISDDQAETLRTEISRRLLAAADKVTQTKDAGSTANWAAIGVIFVLLGASGVLYLQTGVPGMSDQPLLARLEAEAERRADRPSQAEAEAMIAENGSLYEQPAANPEHLELLDRLRGILAEKPDVRGQRLLAENLARLGKWQEAHVAQAEVFTNFPELVTGQDYADHAEYMILASNGYVSPQAESALQGALKSIPGDPRARYYSGLAALQSGRPDLTYELWIRLLNEGPPDAPWVAAILEQIDEVATAVGRAPPRGPDQADINAAQNMSDEDRDAMIQNMVAQLSERLADEGGSPEEWGRLIVSYSALDDLDQAQKALKDARAVFADDTAALEMLDQAADAAGIAE